MKTSTKTAAPKAAATAEKPVERFKVLIAVSNDKTGKAWLPGQYVTYDDFPRVIIYEWLNSTPPVLAAVEVNNGSNTIDG